MDILADIQRNGYICWHTEKWIYWL